MHKLHPNYSVLAVSGYPKNVSVRDRQAEEEAEDAEDLTQR